jgi:hypothetical protein
MTVILFPTVNDYFDLVGQGQVKQTTSLINSLSFEVM